MALRNVVALAGGVGGAKMALGLARVLPPDRLTIIVNVGDDFSLYGLAISPDLDTVVYTLAGVVNPETGWGVASDTVHMLEMMRRYRDDPWFRLGDRDLATHLLRTQWLAEGASLTEVTRRLCAGLGVPHSILPATDSPVRTVVDSVEFGPLEFQAYFVRHRWQPTVTHLEYRGAEAATLPAAVEEALDECDLVIICPSNPLLSIAPILAVPGMRERITGHTCVAVTPIVSGAAIKGPSAKIMRELGMDVSAPAVAACYGDLLSGFVLDVRDASDYRPADFACRVLVADTIMSREQDKIRLARDVLRWVEDVMV